MNRKGPIGWMANNAVAANLLMAVLVVGGLRMAAEVRQEVFPDLEIDMVAVTVAYPGASPAEVESGVVLVVEEAVNGIDGVKLVRSTASESVAAIRVELETGTNRDKALADVKAAVDRIRTFPQDAERPVVSLASRSRPVVSLILYGDHEEGTLRAYGERAREDLLAKERITQVEMSGVRPPEIGVEVSRSSLRAHSLTLTGVAERIRRGAVELPGGAIRTERGEVLLRTDERKDLASQFRDLTLMPTATGGAIKLGDVAEVVEGWRETDEAAYYNGQRAVNIQVLRTGDQTPIEISDIVQEYVQEFGAQLPAGMGVATWNDQSESYRARMDLLLRNAWLGLALVLLILGLFLDPKLAFWVALGIPISFLGGILTLTASDTSFNMVSLFAFIISLGIVVDDAIVVGEAIFLHRSQGKGRMQAALDGTREVAGPVCFSVLTTMVAFTPLLFVPGVMGQIFSNIPSVVIPVLFVSLIESLFVLPAHLAHSGESGRFMAAIERRQATVSKGMERFVDRVYQPFLRAALNAKALTLAVCIASLLAAVGYVAGGHIDRTFLPKIEVDIVTASARLPFGAPVEQTQEIRQRIEAAGQRAVRSFGGPEGVSRGMMSTVGEGMRSFGPHGGGGTAGSHVTDVAVTLADPDVRKASPRELAAAWRKELGEIAGLDTFYIRYARGHGGGEPIDVQLSHSNVATLRRASAELAGELAAYPGVVDVDDGFTPGKPQLDLKLLPEAHALGLSEIDIARQLRSAFYGAEALRQQRGRDELRVMVRLPEADRRSVHAFENLLLRTPGGGETPLSQVASVAPGRADDRIDRAEGRRVVSVTADTLDGQANPKKVLAAVKVDALPALAARYPGLAWSFEGQERSRMESLDALGRGALLALLVVFALLAIPFKSYVQPIIVMSAIPFGLVGALLGHILMGFDLSIISMMGVLALSGIVVNDSLVLVVAVNTFRDAGMSPRDAVIAGSMRRFRPIILTSLTTFFGLVPMVLETSMAARFLIPMALSLGFGVLFATGVILLMIPVMYIVVEDVRTLYAAPKAQPVPGSAAVA